MVGLDDIANLASANKGIVAIGAGTVVAGAVLGGVAVARKKRKAKTKRGRSRDRKYISKQKSETAYQRRRKKLGKKTYGKKYKSRKTTKKKPGKIYYAKGTGQPYKIMRNGQARFIKGKRRKS